MCGIVGAVTRRTITEILLEGLSRLEYRGYDSAGLAVVDQHGYLQRLRRVGKVSVLISAVKQHMLLGNIGMAHTRWATHGKPTERNAHPHVSDHIIVVHNGIIENHTLLRQQLRDRGYIFFSDTDTEVIAHLIHWEQHQKGGTLVEAVRRASHILNGEYSTVIMDSRNPKSLIAAMFGCPLVIGRGIGENFIASDQLAFLFITRCITFLEQGDIAELTSDTIQVWNKSRRMIQRSVIQSQVKYEVIDKGLYRHYMQKEIFEQPQAIKDTLKGRIHHGNIVFSELDQQSASIVLSQVQHIQIIACGTSYHAAMVSRYWFESLADIPCDVDIASEFRYRKFALRPNTLLITVSQSGETADTLAVLRLTKNFDFLGSLTVCNVPSSSLVRESDIVLMTRAGIEIGVASTKTFTTQLTLLLMLVAYFNKLRAIDNQIESNIIDALQMLPMRIEQILLFGKSIKMISKNFKNVHHAIFLGRGDLYPIAMEGALKLKEISYIHAEAYAAGELKHGPLALIDTNMPVIVIAPNNKLIEILKSNIEEICTRGAKLYIFSEKNIKFTVKKNIKIISLPYVEQITAPIFYTIPMQLLAYYIALVKGTNIDQPRNLAKSVTVA
ncbi:glutamine--fructose-6-phosphate transaminase (isomerizing) [Candidatus Curculioniphilus buchneri]|uniref:glutamine--fructose-6-phosphate transaminase (isomerizing) n=1 Tax=Candidatus Curculioniphilus buchneri TaxID=690594 RepID=UPI00376EE795